MYRRTILSHCHREGAAARNARRWLTLCLVAGAAVAAVPAAGAAQSERPAKRLANIVGVAVAEYATGVDTAGRVTSQMEYDEAVSFLGDARDAAARLSGDGADSARTALDSLTALMSRRAPPAALEPWLERFLASLGADAALDMPTRPVDLAAGQRLYATHCAACHGQAGQGDGPLARTMDPPPPALGSAAEMRDRTPALHFRVVSVGVAGTQMVSWSETLTVDERWSIIAWLQSLRAAGPLAEGEGLYMQRCAGCHGTQGASNGPLSAALTRLPTDLASFAWQAERSDAQLAAAIRDGMPGTAMPAAHDLPPQDVDRILAFVRTLSLSDIPTRVASAGGRTPEAIMRAVMTQLDQAVVASRAGRTSEAGDRAFDAYLAFEPLETPARARDPGLVATLERHFTDFRGSVRANDPRAAERARLAIVQGLPAIADLARPSGGLWGAFLKSLLIILREGFEAILVIGAIVALLLKTGHRERLRSIWLGVGFALGASALTAVVLMTILRALPATREVIEGVTMLVAVAVLFSVSYWLVSKVEAARWRQFIRDKVDVALAHGGGTALALVAFLAVYREGAETALFYQALFQEGAGTGWALAAGIVVGGVILTVVFTLFHRYGVKIPLRPFFGITSVLLYYLAFVFMGKGIKELQDGGVVPITILPGWPHFPAMGIFPTVETFLAQSLLVVMFVAALLKTFWPTRSVALPTLQPAPPPRAGKRDINELTARIDRLERRVDEMERSEIVSDTARTQ